MPGSAAIEGLRFAVRVRVVAKYLGQSFLVLASLTSVPATVAWVGGNSAVALRYLAVILVFAAYGAFTLVSAFVLFGIVKAAMGLRVEAEEELEGLDYGEHGMSAYVLQPALSGSKHAVVESGAAPAQAAGELANSES